MNESSLREGECLPGWMCVIKPNSFIKLRAWGDKVIAESNVFTERLQKTKKARSIVMYLNNLSKAVRTQDERTDLIRFVLSENQSPEEQPTGTKCRPDFVAIKIASKAKFPKSVTVERTPVSHVPPESERELVWSQLEATGEIRSKGPSIDAAIAQGATYTLYLLQARPDLVSVVGIFILPKTFEFQLYFADAWGVCCTEAVGFNSEDALPLLVAWMRHLYDPELRPKIKREGGFLSKPTFTIEAEGYARNFPGCVLLDVGPPTSRRRPVIFTAPPLSPSMPPFIIKSQYYYGRRFEESTILDAIHQDGDFPGVVRILPRPNGAEQELIVKKGAAPEEEKEEGGEGEEEEEEEEATGTKERVKGSPVDASSLCSRRDETARDTLLVLQDKAEKPLMDAETPLDALVAIYDLLEVTRCLYNKREILHRDISEGNVMLREKKWMPESSFEDKFGDMCFASHLLGELGPNKAASRLYTRVVLIDFHQAEDRAKTSTGEPLPRSGTPRFMARLVRINKIPRTITVLRPLPEVPALPLYETCVDKRVKNFPENEQLIHSISKDETMEKYSHKLSYDAEAILWLLLYWAIQIQPHTEKEGHQDRIPGDIWVNLTGGDFFREPRRQLVPLQGPLCHPEYQHLDQLLIDLFNQLLGYQEYVELPHKQDNGLPDEKSKNLPEHDITRMQPDYLHEALQRTLVNFIVEHSKDVFMQKKISRTRRRKQATTGASQSLRTVKTTRTREVVEKEERAEGGETEKGEEPRSKKQKLDETAEEKGTGERSGPQTRSRANANASNT